MSIIFIRSSASLLTKLDILPVNKEASPIDWYLIKIISSFCGGLEEILTLELNAGNRICEIYEGDWTYAKCVMLFLAKPF